MEFLKGTGRILLPFREMFNNKKSFEVDYKGKIVNGFFSYNHVGKNLLKFSFVSSKSPYLQAIIMSLSQFKGNIFIDGKEVQIGKNKFAKLYFCEDTTPNEFDVQVNLIDGVIAIGSGADSIGDKKNFHYLSGGNAMVITKWGDNKYRFNCNDFENDDDFDDLIFDLEIIGPC
jgi:hypothetical protein